MKCPACKTKIDHVIVVSHSRQRAELKGKTIVDYSEESVMVELLDIECPECFHSLKTIVQS